MVHSKAKTRAVKAAALMLSIPVMAHAMTVMDRVPLPVPRPTWLDAAPLDEVAHDVEAISAPVQVASLPDPVPLPIARPARLGRVTVDVDVLSDAPVNDAPPFATKVATLPARVPLPIPRPDFLDAVSNDDEPAPKVTRVPRRTPADETARNGSSALHSMIEDYARYHGVPLRLAHRIVQQESRYNPTLKAKAHFGLMQVSLPTAKSMGYGGDIPGLLDAKTNLTYAMPYLANAWIISGGNEEKARRLYMSGYYPDAKRKGLLKELRKADSPAVPGEVEAADAR
jgi:hypothetical protein